jgi:hypothetical protein
MDHTCRIILKFLLCPSSAISVVLVKFSYGLEVIPARPCTALHCPGTKEQNEHLMFHTAGDDSSGLLRREAPHHCKKSGF